MTHAQSYTPRFGVGAPSYVSPSSYWRSRVRSAKFIYPVNSSEDRLKRALHQLARTVNLVENGTGRDDKTLSLAWSDGEKQNTPMTSTIYLDSRIIVENPVSDDDKNIDVLTGKALLLSSMKRTMHRSAFSQYKNAEDGPLSKIASPIWKANEVIKAKAAVIKDWSGFKPYFDVYDNHQMADHYSSVAATARGMNINAASFTQVLVWNILNPNEPILFDDAPAQVFLETILADIAFRKTADSREYSFAKTIAQRILDRFEDESGSNQTPNIDFEDEELFGGRVLSSATTAEGSQPLSLGDESLKPNNMFNAFDYEASDSFRLTEVGLYQFGEGDRDEYTSYVSNVRGEIAAMKKAFSFRKTKIDKWSYGKEEGELDEGSLHKLSLSNPTVWARKTTASKPNLVIGLLVDESGSMAFDTRLEDARRVAITLTESLRDIHGVEFAVFGHTGEVSRMDACTYPPHCTWDVFTQQQSMKPVRSGKQVVIREFFTTKLSSNPYNLTKISAIAENLDGYAIEAAAKRLKSLHPHAEGHLLIHISDGAPSYGMVDHTRKSVDKCVSKLGVEVFAIGVDNAYSDDTGAILYGEGRNVVIKDVMSSLPILTSFLKRKLSRF